MKHRNIGITCIALSTILSTACNSPITPLPEGTEAAEDKTAEANSSLETGGETYKTMQDTACQRHVDEVTGEITFLCLTARHFYVDPQHIWGFQVCKFGANARGVTYTNFQNNPIAWRVVTPNDQLTNDITFTAPDSNSPCTDIGKADMSKVPCNTNTVVEAEVLSPANCHEAACTYHTGGLLFNRLNPNCFDLPSND